MNTEALASAKAQCQAAAHSFVHMQEMGDRIPSEQLAFNHAILLALKGLYEALESQGS
jgi:hypothetical protein